jgi:hypothetical protein
VPNRQPRKIRKEYKRQIAKLADDDFQQYRQSLTDAARRYEIRFYVVVTISVVLLIIAVLGWIF